MQLGLRYFVAPLRWRGTEMTEEIKPVPGVVRLHPPGIVTVELFGAKVDVWAATGSDVVEYVRIGGVWWRASEVLTSDFMDQLDDELKRIPLNV